MVEENRKSRSRKIRSGGPLELRPWHRWVLGVIAALVTAVAACVLCSYRGAASVPDFFLGMAAIGAMVLVALAVIGRLPVGFEVAGFPVEFRADSLGDLIGTVESALKDDDPARHAILSQLQQAVGIDAFRDAKGKYSETEMDDDVFEEGIYDGVAQHSASGPDDHVGVSDSGTCAFVRQLADNAGVQVDFEVKGTGKGKSPKFDYFFKHNGKGVVVEVEKYWNPTTVELVRRKTNRVLNKGQGVDRVIVATPIEGVDEFRKKMRSPDVIVVPSEEIGSPVLLGRLNEFLAAPKADE